MQTKCMVVLLYVNVVDADDLRWSRPSYDPIAQMKLNHYQDVAGYDCIISITCGSDSVQVNTKNNNNKHIYLLLSFMVIIMS